MDFGCRVSVAVHSGFSNHLELRGAVCVFEHENISPTEALFVSLSSTLDSSSGGSERSHVTRERRARRPAPVAARRSRLPRNRRRRVVRVAPRATLPPGGARPPERIHTAAGLQVCSNSVQTSSESAPPSHNVHQVAVVVIVVCCSCFQTVIITRILQCCGDGSLSLSLSPHQRPDVMRAVSGEHLCQ